MIARAGIIASVALLLAPLRLSADVPGNVLESYIDHIADSLPENCAQALQRIQGHPRQLLAMRAYLRAGDEIRNRWSWSAAEIKAYSRTPEYRAFLAETQRVRERFEALNPGYTLYKNTEVRNLDLQIDRDNENPSLEKAGESLRRQALAELSKPDYESPLEPTAIERFKNFLIGWRPSTAAPLAAPGVSRHGQLRAIDFQIMKGHAIVAPTQIAAVKRHWDAAGWTHKLQQATQGSRFRGPLRSPYEPWHYEYDP